jgi:hypothetical protein
MSDPKYTTMMALHQALHQKPVEFENTINGLLADRIQNAVEKKREEVAKSVFGNTDTEIEADDQDAIENGDEETSELAPSAGDDPEAEVTKFDVEEPAEEEPVEPEEEIETPTEEAKEETPTEA